MLFIKQTEDSERWRKESRAAVNTETQGTTWPWVLWVFFVPLISLELKSQQPRNSTGTEARCLHPKSRRRAAYRDRIMHWRRKWQPTPLFLPGDSQGQGSLVGCCLWGRTESETTEATSQQQQQQRDGKLSASKSVAVSKQHRREKGLTATPSSKCCLWSGFPTFGMLE